jgi:hypothetical protein
MTKPKPATIANLSLAHWEYVRALLEQALHEDSTYSKAEYIQNVGFHYRSALEHGFKHGLDYRKEFANATTRHKS